MLKLMLYCRLVRTNLNQRVRSRSGKLPLNLSDDKTCKIGVMTPRSTSMYQLSCTISRHLFDPTEPDRIHKLSNMYIECFLLQDLRPCTVSGHNFQDLLLIFKIFLVLDFCFGMWTCAESNLSTCCQGLMPGDFTSAVDVVALLEA